VKATPCCGRGRRRPASKARFHQDPARASRAGHFPFAAAL
jgi:hypothetical protein